MVGVVVGTAVGAVVQTGVLLKYLKTMSLESLRRLELGEGGEYGEGRVGGLTHHCGKHVKEFFMTLVEVVACSVSEVNAPSAQSEEGTEPMRLLSPTSICCSALVPWKSDGCSSPPNSLPLRFSAVSETRLETDAGTEEVNLFELNSRYCRLFMPAKRLAGTEPAR